MMQNSKDFWNRLQSGVEVAVGGNLPDKLLGVREGFMRYFHDGLEKPVPVSVIAQPYDELATPLPITDEEILALARGRACELQTQLADRYSFYVGTETGLLTFAVEGEARHLVRSWTVILGLGDEAWGSSGSLQLPEWLIKGLDEDEIPSSIPGTRRSGGMVSSLTGHLENRRSATALATLHALATLLYGKLESRAIRRR